MKQQRAWMRCEQVTERIVMWADFWQVEPQHIKLLTQAVYVCHPVNPINLTMLESNTQSYSLHFRFGDDGI